MHRTSQKSIELLVDLAFEDVVPARRYAIAIATVAATLTVDDVVQRAPSADFVLRG